MLALLAAVLGVADVAAAAPADDDRRPVIVELTATADSGAPEQAAPTNRRRSAAVSELVGVPDIAINHRYGVMAGFAAELTEAEIDRLGTDPRVAAVHTDQLRRPMLDDAVPLIDGDVLHGFDIDGSGWTVAVLDTGFEVTHPFLAGKTGTGLTGTGSIEACFARGPVFGGSDGDCPSGGTTATGVGASVPCVGASGCGHGTSVAGIAVGVDGSSGGNDLDGVAPDAGLLPVRVFSYFTDANDCAPSAAPCTLAWDSDTIAGLDHVYEQRDNYDIASVNMSLGGGLAADHCDDTSVYNSPLEQLTAAGIAVVAASGNNGSSSGIAEPACVSEAVAVTATTSGDLVAGFANIDDTVDIAAPGTSIATSAVGGGYTSSFSGTSAAAPVVAGAFAVLREACPAASLDSLTNALEASPTTVSRGGTTVGRIDLDDAYWRLAPASPTEVSGIAGVGEIELSWIWTADSPIVATGFRLTDTATGDTLDVGDPDARSAVWTDRPTGNRSFTVTALNQACASPALATEALTVIGVPGAPGELAAQPIRLGLSLSWSAPTDESSGTVTGYRVTTESTVHEVTGTSFDVEGLEPTRSHTVSVAAVNEAGPGEAISITATPVSSTAGAYSTAGPIRVADTRRPPSAKPGPRQTITVQIAGRFGVPSDATAVAVNLTGVEATGDGFVTAFPSLTTLPVVSHLNLVAGETRPNLAIVPLGANGAIDIYTQSGAHLVVDLAGYWVAGDLPATTGRYRSSDQPIRVTDTRFDAAAKPEPRSTLTIPMAGLYGVPADATAVVVNLTATEATDDGFVTAHDSGRARPTASNLNLLVGETRPNLAIVPLGDDGAIELYTDAGTHLIVDLAGWFTGASEAPGVDGLFTTVTPGRTTDTRRLGPTPPAGTMVLAPVIGQHGIPTIATAVVANLTGTEAIADGFVTAHASDRPRPTASNLNLLTGQTAPNAAIVAPGGDGNVSLFTQRGTHLLADVFGWFS